VKERKICKQGKPGEGLAVEVSEGHLSRVRVGAQNSAAKIVGKSASLGDAALSSDSLGRSHASWSEEDDADVDGQEDGDDRMARRRFCKGPENGHFTFRRKVT